ncbi:hypothetical protein [Acidovorax sp. CCYZU-2555]|uniref:hypothetical protein n=1 Tax=Acidovorax sp. CCYZU-2555 TaxID=2835042 RepID=UPI001BCF54DB|nr:hypothetical protein [Acidovorax sp. CCYZU-2555]MBS7777714.1 hypothetical protein [Acidovorax sp. CCYZU-2555]
MIKDIPTVAEFDSAAKAQFDFAWDIAISFLLSLEEARGYAGVEEEDEKAFWEAARQRVMTALIVTQQGVELALKGRIVAVSPFLLIAGSPSDWPKDSTGAGISFSDFRAIDAQDLIKVHDAVHEEKLNSEFSVLFDSLRKLRNKAMHTVDRNINVSVKEVLVNIIEFHKNLYGDASWVETRRDFLYNSAAARVFFDTEHVEALVVREFSAVFKFLEPAQALKFFNVNKRSRLYICPECKHEADRFDFFETRYAVLRPNEPNSESLFCFVCDSLHSVVREDCCQGGCPGNVLSLEYDICCTCGEDQ